MHGAEGLEFVAHADNLLSHLDGVAVLGVEAGNEGVGIACLDHHHTEVVALKHLVVRLLEVCSLAGTLLREDAGIALAALSLAVVAQVDDLDALKAQVELLGQLLDALVVTQEDGVTDTLGLGLNGRLQHRGVDTLGKHHALGIAACRVVELACELALLPHQFAQLGSISLPVGDRLACHTALHGSLGHSH